MKKIISTLALMLMALTANAQSCPDNNHPHMIDLGLPSGTKWACCNVDAEHPENQSPFNYGGYYAWGEVMQKNTYYDQDYKYYKNGSNIDIGSDIAGTQYDVAHVKWGGSWVMPSLDQIIELHGNCTYEWKTGNGVKGGQFTGPNGSSIFLPAAGYRSNDELVGYGIGGFYWSSMQNPSYLYNAFDLYFDMGFSDLIGNSRNYGFSVRPVSR